MSSDASAKLRLLGTPPRLPLRIALQVALTSIRVRLSRSLVTVSSVVLAVAFLLNVLGENVGNRAVYQAWTVESAPQRQAQALRDALNRPRGPLVLLDRLAKDGEALRAWHGDLGGTDLPINADLAATAVTLGRWIDSLSASQAYLIRRNRTRDEWLLAFDHSEDVDHLVATASQLKGVRLEIPVDRLTTLAGGMADLRQTLEALAASEEVRLNRVADQGGAEALLTRYAAGEDVPAQLMPVDQILPGFGEAEAALLRAQIRRDQARLRAAEVVSRFNAGDPSLLDAGDVDGPALATALASAAEVSPGARLIAATGLAKEDLIALLNDPARAEESAAALNRVITADGLYRRDAFRDVALGSECEALSKRVKLSERQRSRLNRLLLLAAFPSVFSPAPPVTTLDLRSVLDAKDDASLAKLRESVAAAAGDIGLENLDQELARRSRLGELERTFQGIAYDPEASAEKTFWLVVLSLLVCIVGIVNTMMMAVTERFREIATMKCLGAMDSFILKSFLIESGLTGAVGSALGAIIGVLLVILQVSVRYGGSFWSVFPAADLAIVAVVALVCGLALAIIGALLPALKASRMHPIEAMRIDA